MGGFLLSGERDQPGRPGRVAPCTSILPMPRTALEYYTEILDKISFADRAVFRKELRKAFRKLLPQEREELKQWFRHRCLCAVPVTRQRA